MRLRGGGRTCVPEGDGSETIGYVREGIYCLILVFFFAIDVHVVVRRVTICKRVDVR